MIRLFILIIIIIFILAGCSKTTVVDQCIRSEIFLNCIKMSTDSKLYEGTVNSCSKQSLYMAIRRVEHVAPECAGY